MERFVKGDVVVLPFPFSDLSKSKRRPALVVASLQGDDIILSQITTVPRKDKYSIILLNSDFETDSLNVTSLVRLDRLFTADSSIVLYKIGVLKKHKLKEIEKNIVNMLAE